MEKLKKPLLFSLVLIPIAAVAAIFTVMYQFELYDPAILEEAIAQVGSLEVIMAISVVQVVMYAVICGFAGYLLAEKLGLMRSFKLEKGNLITTLIISLVCGVLFSLDYWTFGKAIPQVAESYAATLTYENVIASVLYGGIIEEVMMRLFLMSLIAFLIWKLFFRKQENVPTKALIAANIIAALLFAAGHLPATIMAFGGVTPLILFRCFLLNGGFGLVFGHLYRKYGIQYAMVAHMGCHIISKLIWIILT